MARKDRSPGVISCYRIEMTTETTHTAIACTQCGCVCDDLTIQTDAHGFSAFQPGCPIADRWYQAFRETPNGVPVTVDGKPSPLNEGILAAVDLLTRARSPLIYGLSRSSTGGQRAACRLADCLRAAIDTTASTCHAPSIMALQRVGEETATLGEIKNRSDLIIYWGSNPLRNHPRHYPRVVDVAGKWVQLGRADRHVVVVDTVRTESAEIADTFIQVPPGSDFQILWALRALLRGFPLTGTLPEGVSRDTLVMLAERLKSSRYGAVFFGLGLTDDVCGHHNVEALLQLVNDVNQFTRCVARRMRVAGDVAGADSVLCWQTGYPFSVSFHRGYPQYNPGEFTASAMLQRGEVDCLVLVGAESLDRMPIAAQNAISDIPVILLDYPHCSQQRQAAVRFNTAIYGIHRPGVAYRMDEVPVPLRAWQTSDLPSDEEILNSIADRVESSLNV